MGNLLLTLGFLPVASGVTPGNVPWVLPNDPRLAGITTYFQAVTVPFAKPTVAVATTALGLTMF